MQLIKFVTWIAPSFMQRTVSVRATSRTSGVKSVRPVRSVIVRATEQEQELSFQNNERAVSVPLND